MKRFFAAVLSLVLLMSPQVNADELALTCRHYNPEGFYRALEAAESYPAKGRILAATSPHFLPVMSYTASLLKTAAEQDTAYDTVILAGPNHGGEGLPVIIGPWGWRTAFGVIEPDYEAAAALAGIKAISGRTEQNRRRLEDDHSLATLTTFIKFYLPDAKIVSLMLSKGATTADVEALAAAIYEIGQTKSILLIGSIDFSHYLDINETAVKDAETEAIITAGDFRAMEPLDSGFLDSPETMALLMRYAELSGCMTAEHWDGVILPESDIVKDIGYSYHVYTYTENEAVVNHKD
jgi:AmmeMemoRadiSam system protein B